MKTKKLTKITEPLLMEEAQQEIENARINQVIYTSEDDYTIMEITKKSFKCVTYNMMNWRPGRKIISKNQIQFLLEEGKAVIN